MTPRDPEDDADHLSFSLRLEAPPEKVWRALTVPAYVERWLDAPPAGVGHAGPELVEAEPPTRLRWRWSEDGMAAGSVTFTLRPDGSGTLLRLVHERRPAVTLPPAANGNGTITAMAA